MKINNIKINAFGKLKNKDINFSEGINIVYGENESGKSSMQKFISGMFFGLSKNKNGKDISDFDRYKPWNSEEFSGKISYTLDDGESFEVYREFKKKNPVIYNSQKEDISKKFNIDKSKGIEFFVEQTGIDEEIFNNTAITEQDGIKLSKLTQNSIVQKMSNLITTGDDNISFKKTMDKINKKQNEDVGSLRTMQRPLNIVENKIDKLLDKKKELSIYKENIYENITEKEKLILEQKYEETKLNFLKAVKTKIDNNRIKTAEINFNKNLEKEYDQKINELNSKILNNNSSKENEKRNYKNYYILLGIFALIFIILMIVNPYKLINLPFLIPIVFIICKIYSMIKKESITQSDRNNNDKIISEIEILNKNKKAQEIETMEKEEKLNNEIKREKQVLIEEYINVLDLGFMEENFNKNYDELLKEIEQKENRLNTIKFEIKTIENSYENINNKLDDLSKIEEELEDAEMEREELLSLNNSYNIAKECMEKAYTQVKENVSPRFMQNLCEIISKISNNRYNNVNLNDDDGLTVEINNGSYIPVSRLSVGTIDQMYLSLRLSALYEISNESMPIILDESFAYFDEERLKNILRYLNTNFKANQIIIFTCSKREENALKNMNIDYSISEI